MSRHLVRHRMNWLQFALLVGVALGVLCLLIGDQVDCRPKKDQGANNKDDADKSEDDAGDDDDDEKKENKTTSKETLVEKKVAEDSGEEKSGGVQVKKDKKNKKENKIVKETKTVTKVTTTTKTPKSHSRNSTSTVSPGKHERGNKTLDHHHGRVHHRVSGGFQESDVPDFLATLWQPREAHRGEDGRYVGNGILVGDGKMLIHSESKSKLDQRGDLPSNHDEGTRAIPEDVVFGNPATLNIDGVSKRNKYRDLEAIKTGVGGSPFGLYNIRNRKPITVGEPQLPKKYPTLEHDHNNFGQDCNAYGWTRSLGAADIDTGAAGSNMQHRPFVKFPVEHDPGSCKNGHCQLSSDHGSVCDGMADYGTPVLCGEKKVLTYLIKGIDTSVDGQGCVRGNIPAFHVGSMIDELKEHVPGISHTGGM